MDWWIQKFAPIERIDLFQLSRKTMHERLEIKMYTFNPTTDRPADRIGECRGNNKHWLAPTGRLSVGIDGWKRYGRDKNRLFDLNDYMLKDIGLSREYATLARQEKCLTPSTASLLS